MDQIGSIFPIYLSVTYKLFVQGYKQTPGYCVIEIINILYIENGSNIPNIRSNNLLSSAIEDLLDKTQHLPEDKFYRRRLSFLFLS